MTTFKFNTVSEAMGQLGHLGCTDYEFTNTKTQITVTGINGKKKIAKAIIKK
jgi:hypothetical protein